MNIWTISLQNLKSKPLYTFLNILILSLSIALLLGIKQLKNTFKHQIDHGLGEIDLVIGAKGSPLQLVLASILHLDNPTGNIPYKAFKNISKNTKVKLAVPISYGDNYKGYRIVGTTINFLTIYKSELQNGRPIKKSMEVILGNTVAKQLKLKVGDSILSAHGLIENTIDIHEQKLTVVGILKPTKKVIDRLIITNLKSVWDVHQDHTTLNTESYIHKHKENHEHEHNQDNAYYNNKEITSILISLKNPRTLLTLPRKINKQTNMIAVLPKYELEKIYHYTGIGFNTMTWIAYLILFISSITIFVSLYKMIKERAFDLALLRTYGASNLQLIKMIAYEGIIIILSAFITGLILIKIALYFILKIINTTHKNNMVLELTFYQILQTLMLVCVAVILSTLIAIWPIIKMNISTILSNEK